MELDNEGGIGFRLCYLSMEGGREGGRGYVIEQ